MSASVASKLSGPQPQVTLPSRLIPGLPLHSRSAVRKKVVSVAWDGSPRSVSDLPCHQPAPASAWSRVASALLPQPATHSQRAGLALHVLADFFFIFVGFSAGAILLAGAHGLSLPRPGIAVFFMFAVVFTLLGYSERLYHPDVAREAAKERFVLGKVALFSVAIVSLAYALSGLHAVSPYMFVTNGPFIVLGLLGWREWRRGSDTQNQNNARNVLIIGAGTLGRRIARSIECQGTKQRRVKGFLDDAAPLGHDVLGRVDDLSRIARREFVDEVILAVPPNSEEARIVIWEARRNRIDVKIAPDLRGFDCSEISLEKFDDVAVLTLCEERIPSIGLSAKRAVDLALSTMVLMLVSPLLAAIAIAIKIDSPGPVFYRAPRMGRKGGRFLCAKFRTMVSDADRFKEELRARNERQGAFFKLAKDPRITRVGGFLRRYSLDELPQLWNVFRGEMSLVGPRPHPIDDFERYKLEDWQRLEVLPGLTGLWQVTARRDPSFERGMTLDREYIGSWSLRLDFKILFRTLGVVLRGEGA